MPVKTLSDDMKLPSVNCMCSWSANNRKKIMKFLTTLFLACTVVIVHAQEFKKPLEVENTSKPLEPPVDGQQKTRDEANNNILIESLKGIWVHRSAKDVVNPVEAFEGTRISEPSKLTSTPVFKDMLNQYLNKPLSVGRLGHMMNEILSYFRLLDYPIVDVFAPEQDITEGVLQVVVKEAKIGKIHVTGNRFFSTGYVASAMRVEVGDLPHVPTIYEDANWLSENPFLRVQPVFGPGKADATTDLFLEVEDTRPLRVFATYSNAGNDLVGEDQYSAGVNYGNLWGKGHQVSYQYTTGRSHDGLNAHAVSYKLPLHSRRQNLVFAASTTRTKANQAGLAISGESDEASVRYQHPLSALPSGLEHALNFGFEWKRSKNALEFGFIPISDTTIEIGQAVIGYNGKFSGKWGKNSFDVSLVKNLPGIFRHQNDRDYEAVRAGADADYTILRAGYQHQAELPWKMNLVNNLQVQLSDNNLVSNEQLTVTGQGAVRGFEQGTFNNVDSGLVLRNDLYFPAFNIGDKDRWQPYVFFDYANFRSRDRNLIMPNGSVSTSESISSVGVGLQLKIKKLLTLSTVWGEQLNNIDGIRKSEDFYIQATIQF